MVTVFRESLPKTQIKFSTPIELLCQRAAQQPDRVAYNFLANGVTLDASWTYRELDQKARAIAASLQSRGAIGDRALLLYPPGLEFIAAFLGCLYAGTIAVPVPPPEGGRLKRTLPRLMAIAKDAGSSTVLGTSAIVSQLQGTSEFQEMFALATETIPDELAADWKHPGCDENALAYFQYTSGSTSKPKGVIVSHGNLMHNSACINQSAEYKPDDVSVTWLPYFHDYGLVEGIVQPLYAGCPLFVISPMTFLKRPIRWLEAISRYKATHSGGPNFAYDYCVSKSTPEQRAALDLSNWRVAHSAAEPIRKETLERFLQAFAPAGFRWDAFCPSYGLAEATLMVTTRRKIQPPIFYKLQADALEKNRIVAAQGDTVERIIAGCGQALGNLKIVDPETCCEVESDRVGEIWFSSASVGLGYWKQEEQTTKTFQAYTADSKKGPFLRTGDLGFVKDGELFVTGRIKDLIIIGGVNHYPQDIELTVQKSHAALRVDAGAAFSIEFDGEEKLAIAQEVDRSWLKNINLPEVISTVRQAISDGHNLSVYAILLLKQGSIPKTSSGKIQRQTCRSRFLAGTLDLVGDWTHNSLAKADYWQLLSDVDSLSQQVKGRQGDNETGGQGKFGENVGTIAFKEQNLAPTENLETSSHSRQTVAEIKNWLVSYLARHLKIEAIEIETDRPFAYYGLSSRDIVGLIGDLEDWLGRQLSPTLAYDCPTVKALATYLGSPTDIRAGEPKSNRPSPVSTEPIAIVGAGCRFPGARDLESFWQLLRDGVDAISQVPASRWDLNSFYDPSPELQPGKMNTVWGGFLENPDQFDARFFGIARREAERMDPQQRLTLEVSWEALENAGQSPEKLGGSQTGVFMGISANDYGRFQYGNISQIDAYAGTGNALSLTANRLSYVLDLRGPSMAVDTACSSSLVAVHLACQSLRNGDCDLAIAGGVNLILTPQLTITFSQAQMMAPDGRCKTFDANANGYVRGEGCGVVILKRLEDAIANEDNIMAIVRGSAANEDGRSNGLTAPNGLAQQAVIRKALEKAGVEPAEVSYVEAHGTGTALGDPIEIESLKAVLMEERTQEQPCAIGSVKTNIGHLEAAAGMAGLIKTVLALQHEEIPPHLHLKELNPLIALENTPFSIPTETQPWPKTNGNSRRIAGVSSFGFGGSNAHLVLEEANEAVSGQRSAVSGQQSAVGEEPMLNAQCHSPCPPLEALEGGGPNALDRPFHILALSARSNSALSTLASSYETFLKSSPEVPLADVCFTANTGRSHFDHRLTVIASKQEELAEKLIDYKAGREVAGLFHKQLLSSSAVPKIAFLFTGQGSQYVNMGRQLYQTQAVFREAMDRCDRILRSELERPLLEVIYPETKDDLGSSQGHGGIPTLLDQTAYTQPALFAIEYALYQLWQSWGIQPAAVMGHSVGEYVAACIAGVFSLEDGLKLIATRGRLMQQLLAEGTMVSLMASESRVREAIGAFAKGVAIAAINGPQSVVISGESEAVRAIVSSLESEGIKTKQLQVSHAFHSPLMEQMLASFETVAKEVTYSKPQKVLISNVSGLQVGDEIASAAYWVEHVRKPVRFAESMKTLENSGYELFLEIGPKPIMLGMGRKCWPEDRGVWLPSLRPQTEEWQQMLESLGQLYVLGSQVDWSGFDRDYLRRKVAVPTYPFQRERYWIENINKNQKRPSKKSHPLLGERLNFAGEQKVFETYIEEKDPSYLSHHKVFNKTLFPTTAYLEMAVSAARDRFKTESVLVENLVIGHGLSLSEGEQKIVQTILNPLDKQGYKLQIFSQVSSESEESEVWHFHAKGEIKPLHAEKSKVDIEKYRGDCDRAIEVKQHYQKCLKIGIDYGSSFQGIQSLQTGASQALAQIKLPQELAGEAGDYQCHPALLDAALQIIYHVLPETSNEKIYLPVGIDKLEIYTRLGLELWAIASLTEPEGKTAENISVQVTLVSPEGEIVARVVGLRVKQATPQTLLGTEGESITDWLYEVEWRAKGRLGRLWPTSDLLEPLEIEQQLSQSLTELVATVDQNSSSQISTSLEELSIEYIVQALLDLGWPYLVGDRFTTEAANQRLGIVPSHRRLFKRMLEIIASEGMVRSDQQEWQVLQTLASVNPSEKIPTQIGQYPDTVAELTLLKRCGSQLSEVLRGTLDPVQLVFPSGDMTTATQLYQDTPTAKVMNTIVQQAIAKAIEKVPQQRGIRLLEIGAGTGGTTSYILPHLNPNQTEYIFTDIGKQFTSKAQEKFREYPFLRYEALDIELDPTTQGFEAHQYDVIIAANVLHATSSMKQTLTNVRKMLAPGGMLVLLEVTSRQRWLDLVFGLLEGWWKFQDRELRSDYPLLSRNTWKQLLSEMGFTQVVTMPERSGMPEILSQQTVIVAQASKTRLEKTASVQRGWLLLADQQGIGQKLASQLCSVGEACTLVFAGEQYQQIGAEEFTINPDNPEEIEQVVETVAAKNQSLYGVVQCWTTKAGVGENINSQELANLSKQGCGTTLFLVQALVKWGLAQPPRLWLATSGAQAGPGDIPVIPGVSQSSVWGMGKAIALEHPELNCTRVDLDPNQTVEQQADLLFQEIWSEDREDQVVLRGDERYVPRLVTSHHRQAAAQQLKIPSGSFRLAMSERGSLDNLTLESLTRRAPAAGEVEIKVKVTGLNFRDVLIALNIYPGTPIMGGDCAGEIVAVGPEVKEFQVGDAVMAMALGSFSQYITVKASLVALKPEKMSLAQAASIPVNFLTAYYALHHLAEISAGDRVLIHAAAGGTGMAAVQIAQNAGAEVFATASPPKWETLRQMGVKYVMNSRTVEFADQIMESTQGKGVNIVLNTLTSGEFISKSLSVLSPQGKFVELAARDIWDEEQMKQNKSEIAYSIVDMTKIAREQPELIRSMFQELIEKFERSWLKPPPLKLFPIESAISAFRYMQQAKHIGKIVVTQTEAQGVDTSEKPLSFRSDATYLITGGMGGLGLLVSKWMVSKGAKHLILIGRSVPSETAREKIISLEKAGASVVVEKADVSDVESLTRVMQNIEQSGIPLAGVMHGAGMLSDGVLQNQSWQSFAKVMAPKVQGGWNLHKLTQNQPLDFFVLFSSAASLLGAAGQGNHSAANGFLDGLAHYRQSMGLSGLSIHWGPISQIGEAAERGADVRFQQQGMGTISPEKVLEYLELLMKGASVEVGVVPIDWSVWQERVEERVAKSPFLADWHRKISKTTLETNKSEFLLELEAAAPKERRGLLVEQVRSQAALILGISDPESISLTRGFFDLGMDSLTSVELRNKLQATLDCAVPSTLVLDYPTIDQLVDYLMQELEVEQEQISHERLVKFSSEEAKVEVIAKKLAEKLEANWE